jgi:rhamnogalacturonyl hydrolase YesR
MQSHSYVVFAAGMLVLGLHTSSGQNRSETEACLRAVADGVIRDATFRFVDRAGGGRFTSPEKAPARAELTLESGYNDWRYWNGVLIVGMMHAGDSLNQPAYADFARRDISFNFDSYRYFQERYRNQRKWEYPFAQRFVMEELDDCGAMGAGVVEVYRRDRQDRYRAYIDQVADYMGTKQTRLEDGTFVRPFPQKWTLWTDDLYMSVSFLSRMGELSGDRGTFDDAARQVVSFHKYLFDPRTGLMTHYWYSDVASQGVAFWGRANGWAILAQVDLLERLPLDHPQRKTLLDLFRRHILGIARYQSSEGLWHQLLDKVDSYLETSCSAMFTYAIARAVNKGYLEPRYAAIALRGWEGVVTRIRPDGRIEGICAGTGVSDELAFYYHRPTPLNDPHGVGAVLLAGSEVLNLPR